MSKNDRSESVGVRVGCLLLLLACSAAGQNRFQFDDDRPCYIDRSDWDLVLELVNRVSAAWERGDTKQIASQLLPVGNVFVPGEESFKGRFEVEEAICKPLVRETFKGSRLEMVFTCFRYLEQQKMRQAQLFGFWRISRPDGQQRKTPGPPPAEQSWLARGDFDGVLIKQEGVWAVGSLRLELQR